MGRELKRIALDFIWPLNKVWKGYQYDGLYEKCPNTDCFGGETSASRWLSTFAATLHGSS